MKAIEALLAKGAEVNAASNEVGNTALSLARDNGHEEAAAALVAAGARE